MDVDPAPAPASDAMVDDDDDPELREVCARARPHVEIAHAASATRAVSGVALGVLPSALRRSR
eukprot:5565383-Prymnesium_polylepis.1